MDDNCFRSQIAVKMEKCLGKKRNQKGQEITIYGCFSQFTSTYLNIKAFVSALMIR